MVILSKSPSLLSLPALLHDQSPSDFDSDSDFECELSDNTTNDNDNDNDRDHELPARPASRIGYNHSYAMNYRKRDKTHTNGVQENASRSLTLRWTRSFFQRRSFQANPTTLPSKDEEKPRWLISTKKNRRALVTPLPLAPVEETDMDVDMDLNESSKSLFDESDMSDSEDADSSPDHLPSPARVCSPEPESTIFLTLSEQTPASTHSDRPKFSRRRSPLSPYTVHTSTSETPDSDATAHAFKTTFRHSYTHRGYSRHALQHLRSFWASKREEWAEGVAATRTHGTLHAAALAAKDAYAGCEADVGTCVLQCQYSIASYPRTGDVTALRDPYSVDIDMCFARMPLWTMHKMFWMLALKAAVSHREMVSEKLEEEGAIMESASTGLSDASDRTLVDPEEPMTALTKDLEACSMEEMSVDEVPRQCSFEEIDDTLMEDVVLDDAAPCKLSPAHVSPTLHERTSRPNWALTAYDRWDLLVMLFRRDPPHVPQPTPTRSPKARSFPRFFLGDTEGGDDDDWLDEQGQPMIADEEEDYGVLMANPVLGSGRAFDVEG